MAGKVEYKGVIGTKEHMVPQVVYIPDGNGGQREMRTFKMWAENYVKPYQTDERTGKKRPQREVVQVVLPYDERGKKLFELLSPGRRVIVTGALDHRPLSRENKKTGKLMAYPNPICYMGFHGTLEFLDQDPIHSAQQTLGLLTEKGLITDEQKISFMTAVQAHVADRRKPPIKKVAESEEGPLTTDDDGLFPEE